MLYRNLGALLVLLACLVFAGCSHESAEEMYSTAKFEELQNNRPHAIQLYEEIVRKYPETEYGKKAQERLTELKAGR